MSCVLWNDPLLARLSHDLAGWALSQPVPGMMAIELDERRTVTVTSRRKRLFMGQITHTLFRLEGVCALQERVILLARQPGWLKCQPVVFETREAGHDAGRLLQMVKRYPIIARTLGELDYRRFRFTLAHGHWRCEVEPFAASEVRLSIPPMRRYLRLNTRQRMLLLSLFQLLGQMMARLAD